MGDLCEFNFIDGPNVSFDPAIQYFVNKGVTPPYKRWMTMVKRYFYMQPDRNQEVQLSKALPHFRDVIECVMVIANYINK